MNFNILHRATAALALSACFFVNIASAGIISPAESNYTQVYGLDIDQTDLHTNVPYYLDNSASIADNSFDRIAYHMELQRPGGILEWVWVSMDAFTNDASLIGVPSFAGSNTVFQQTLTNMNVFSNKAGIVTGLGISTGNIEFWPFNYGQNNVNGVPNASSGIYDMGDEHVGSFNYGSMQIHNYGAGQTLFALNRFVDANKDLGIGNATSGPHSDWTFTQNSNSYSVKTLDVFVSSSVIPEPSMMAIMALAIMGFASRRFKK